MDLQRERSCVSVPVQALSHVIHGSKEEAERAQFLNRLIESHPDIDPQEQVFMSHSQRYTKSLKTVKALLDLKKEHNLSLDDYNYMLYATSEWHSLSLQGVYLGALTNLADKEQLAKYYQKSLNFEIIGCYAQTELAHGSNVKAIQTLATYLPEEDVFDLHTPSIEACKWWVGSLGKSSTHGIVFARLMLEGEDKGVHAFMVPLRDHQTHQLLPGVFTGDIGPKFGFAAVDNGFLRLNHVKIPRQDLLANTGRVEKGGRYVKPQHDKLTYAGMTATRVNITKFSGGMLGRAATIATRYSIVRRQGGQNEKGEENQVLDYSLQQHRVLSQVANSYAVHFSAALLTKILDSFNQNAQKGLIDPDILTDLHIASSSLKSCCTTIVAAGIEDCRKACGGHGYSQFSGLPDLFTSFVHVCTAEGDNYILTQQTVRYLLKSLKANELGKFRSQAAFNQFLRKNPRSFQEQRSSVSSPAGFSDPKVQIEAFENRAGFCLLRVLEKLETEAKKGRNPEEAWEASLIEIYRASMAYSQLIILFGFFEVLERNKKDVAVFSALKSLCDLFFLNMVEEGLSDFLESGYLNRKQVRDLRNQKSKQIEELRREAVGLVDAWGFSDLTLNSALGRKDGNVYPALFEWAQKEPLNSSESLEQVRKALAPLISPQLSKL